MSDAADTFSVLRPLLFSIADRMLAKAFTDRIFATDARGNTDAWSCFGEQTRVLFPER